MRGLLMSSRRVALGPALACAILLAACSDSGTTVASSTDIDALLLSSSQVPSGFIEDPIGDWHAIDCQGNDIAEPVEPYGAVQFGTTGQTRSVIQESIGAHADAVTVLDDHANQLEGCESFEDIGTIGGFTAVQAPDVGDEAHAFTISVDTGVAVFSGRVALVRVSDLVLELTWIQPTSVSESDFNSLLETAVANLDM